MGALYLGSGGSKSPLSKGVSISNKSISEMSDTELANLYRKSLEMTLPNGLNDAENTTQRFVFAAGLNEKPLVLDDDAYYDFLEENGIRRVDQLARSVSSNYDAELNYEDIIDMMKYSDYNYIGGKHGGAAYGYGTYFDQNGGYNTGYGDATAVGVLNPATTKVVDYYELPYKIKEWSKTHPEFEAAVGTYRLVPNPSIYAVAMGYNVIRAGSYFNVLDRRALVYRKSNIMPKKQ